MFGERGAGDLLVMSDVLFLFFVCCRRAAAVNVASFSRGGHERFVVNFFEHATLRPSLVTPRQTTASFSIIFRTVFHT